MDRSRMTTGTIIVPEALIPQARELARCLNPEPGGEATFSLAPLRQTPDGRRWSVASGQFTREFLMGFKLPLGLRPWPYDLALAAEAQTKIDDEVLPLSDGTWPALKPDRISYVIGLEGVAVLAIWGLEWPAE